MATGMKSSGKRRFARRVVKKVSKTVKAYVAQAIKGASEPKYTNQQLGITSIGSSSATGSVFQEALYPTQGVANNQRIGDRIKWTSVHCRLSFGIPPYAISTSASGNYVRIMLVHIPASAIITTVAQLETDLFDGTIASTYVSSLVKKESICNVLYDKLVHSTTGGVGAFILKFNHKKMLKKLVEFTAGTVTVEKGRLGIYFCSSSATATDCIMTGTIRWNYMDV